MEIYADVLFLINFFMDFSILFITNKLLELNVCIRRLLLGSGILALLYCVFIFNFKSYGLIFQLMLMAVMIFVIYKPDALYMYLKELITVNIIALAVGGISFVLYSYDMYDLVISGNTVHIFPLSVPVFGVAISAVIILFLKKWFNNRLLNAEKICNIKLSLGENEVIIRALVDTGNSLKDPITNKPVIIIEDAIAQKLLKDINLYGIRMLPYKSLGKGNGLLKGFNVDKAEINNKTFVKPVIGIYDNKFSNGAFNALISPEMVNGGYDA